MWYEGRSDRRGSWGYPPGQFSPDKIEERSSGLTGAGRGGCDGGGGGRFRRGLWEGAGRRELC